jgi:hypothetical protein
MDGNWRKQIEVLTAKASEDAELLRTGRVSKGDAWYAFTASFSKSLGYRTIATCITEEEWEAILKPLEGTLLQKCGIALSFPRAVLYTSKQFQGLGAKHFWYLQELQHLETLCTETQNPSSPVGLLLSTNAEDLRLEAGCSGSFTDIPWDRQQDVITKFWLSDLMIFCQNEKIGLVDPIPQLRPQRAGDRTLMDAFLATKHPIKILRQATAWRQYLQVTFLSDITTADGTKILPNVWAGSPIHGTLRIQNGPDHHPCALST